jgi:two-component system response regulator MprA
MTKILSGIVSSQPHTVYPCSILAKKSATVKEICGRSVTNKRRIAHNHIFEKAAGFQYNDGNHDLPGGKMSTVLIVDDDRKLLKMLQRTLLYEGLEAITAVNGAEALTKIDVHQPAVIILDWMMPGMNGIEVVQRLRAENNQVMILMLTARDAIENRVEGLESGADDYLIKPFAPAELVARVQALLRRAHAIRPSQAFSFSDLTLDPGTREARRGQRPFDLTPTEFDLLLLFMRHPRQVLERAQILADVWGYDFGGDDNVLEVYIGYLRKKTQAADEPRLIHTVRGVGYVLREE